MKPVLLRANPVERLVASTARLRRRDHLLPAILFGAFLLAHAALLAMFFVLAPEEALSPEQEISVEVVPPPPEPQAQQSAPEPEQPKQEEKPKEEAKPPPPLDLKPAFDAPRAPTEEKLDREAADKETSASRAAPPTPDTAANKPAPAAPDAKGTPAPTQAPAAERAAIDKPDAEAIERAEEKPDNPQPTASPDKPAPTSAGMPMYLRQLSQLQQMPDYKLAGAAMPSPVTGGTAQDNYLSRLYAVIMPKYRHLKMATGKVRGQIDFIVDTTGNLLHVGLVQSSGSSEADSAALMALRTSAPFPPPPRGLPSITFRYD